MCRCLNCGGRFFKNLETRALFLEGAQNGSVTLLLKKRCKRCKHKYLYRKDLPENTTAPIPHSLWEKGIRISGCSSPSRGFVFTSDYSKKISRKAEDTASYLRHLSQVAHRNGQGGVHD